MAVVPPTRSQGYRLANGVYQPMDEYPLRSAILGLELREEENLLRLYNPRTEERLPIPNEVALAHRAAEAARKAAQHQLEAEAEARLDAEARTAAAEAEIARLRALLGQKES